MAANKIARLRPVQSEKMKAKWADPEFRQKMSHRKSGAPDWNNPEERRRRTESMVLAKSKALKSKDATEFESRCYAILDSINLAYEKHRPMLEALTIPDAFVPAMNLCIYFDSEYWHSLPCNAEKDRIKRGILRSLGYSVLAIRCDHHARRINPTDIDELKAFCLRFTRQ